MRHVCQLLLLVSVVLFSCKKDGYPTIPIEAPAPPVLLKEVIVDRLPSPYYHFEYDTTGKVKFVSFASGLTQYNVVYEGDRISEMRNNIIVNKDRLQYVYDNEGRATTVNYNDSTGLIYTRIIFTYDAQKLIKAERQRKSSTNFITDKTMTFSYYPDDNLFEITYHYSIPGQPESSVTIRFEKYDTKINVEGFSLIHNDFFDHLVLLPNVQLQKNNPGKESSTGDGDNYSVDYTYTYNDKNLPLKKTGELTILNGPIAGRKFQTNSTFSYY